MERCVQAARLLVMLSLVWPLGVARADGIDALPGVHDVPFGVIDGSLVRARAGLGYGSSGSGMYLDPVHEPIAFVPQALQRYPVLMGDAVLAVRSSWWSGGFPWARQLVDAGWFSPLWAADLRPLRAVNLVAGKWVCHGSSGRTGGFVLC